MIIGWLLSAALIGPHALDGVGYRELTIDVEGQLIGNRWLDIDGDGRLELCLTILTKDKSRELRFYRMGSQSLELTPFRVLPVRDDAIAYGLAELRDDPGRELFFLTKSGVWSFSIGKQGYRGNVERLLQTELIYDIADPDELPFWEYVLPGAERDKLLLPTADGFALFGPIQGGNEPYGALTEFTQLGRPRISINEDQGDAGGSIRLGPSGISFSKGGSKEQKAPFLRSAQSQNSTFLSNVRRVSAPALLDIDGDGLQDMVFQRSERLLIHLNRDGKFLEQPDRVEPFPKYLGEGQGLRFSDLDGDGDQDLIATPGEEGDDNSSLKNSTHVVFLLLNDGKRLLPEKPSQVLKFEANRIQLELLDVDGDGRMDLAIQKFELPSMLDTLTQFELKLTDILFLGEEGSRPLARKPVFKHTLSFDAESITQVAASRSWELDCTGDGIADQVSLDLKGNIVVHPITRKTKFFGGSSWHRAESAWYQTRAASGLKPIQVKDVNGDGLGDIISPGNESLLILLSTPSER